jgi:hypothetical protein
MKKELTRNEKIADTALASGITVLGSIGACGGIAGIYGGTKQFFSDAHTYCNLLSNAPAGADITAAFKAASEATVVRIGSSLPPGGGIIGSFVGYCVEHGANGAAHFGQAVIPHLHPVLHSLGLC